MENFDDSSYEKCTVKFQEKNDRIYVDLHAAAPLISAKFKALGNLLLRSFVADVLFLDIHFTSRNMILLFHIKIAFFFKLHHNLSHKEKN